MHAFVRICSSEDRQHAYLVVLHDKRMHNDLHVPGSIYTTFISMQAIFMVVWNTGLSHVRLICRVSIAEGSSGIDEVLVSHSIATPRRDLEGP